MSNLAASARTMPARAVLSWVFTDPDSLAQLFICWLVMQRAAEEQRRFLADLMLWAREGFRPAAQQAHRRRLQRNQGIKGWHAKSAPTPPPPPPPPPPRVPPTHILPTHSRTHSLASILDTGHMAAMRFPDGLHGSLWARWPIHRPCQEMP